MKYSFLVLFIILFASCENDIVISDGNTIIEEEEACTKYNIDSSLVSIENSDTFLIAGTQINEKFNISNANFEVCKLNQGLGREYFPALYDPIYDPISAFQYNDAMECIIIFDEGVKKIFPYSVLSQHEAINEVINGEAMMIIYCELARLAAVYDRTYCGKTLTFAPSGYTYADNNYWGGVQGILLWDRETESLWWPLNDKCVSGILTDVDIKKAPTQYWDYITWGNVKTEYPDAVSLSHTQNIVVPTNLPTYTLSQLDCE